MCIRDSTITELVVVWSVCSVCTSVAKSKVVGPHIQLDTLQRFTLFALAVARSSKTSVLLSRSFMRCVTTRTQAVTTLDVCLCTLQRVFAHGNTEYDTLFPLHLYKLASNYVII